MDVFYRFYECPGTFLDAGCLGERRPKKKVVLGLVPADCDERNCTEAYEGYQDTKAG